MNKQNNEIKT